MATAAQAKPMGASAILAYFADPATAWQPYVWALIALGVGVALSARSKWIMAGALILVLNWIACQLGNFYIGADDPIAWTIAVDGASAVIILLLARQSLSPWLIVLALTYAAQLAMHGFYATHRLWPTEDSYRTGLLGVAWLQLMVVGSWSISDVVGRLGVSRHSAGIRGRGYNRRMAALEIRESDATPKEGIGG